MFVKGDSRINRKGRPLSDDNKFKRILEVLEDVGFHPAKEMIQLYRKSKSDELKRKILKDLMVYMEGMKKPVFDEPEKKVTPEDSKKKAEAQAAAIKKLEEEAQANANKSPEA